MKKIKTIFWTLVYKFKFRKYPYNEVCCCGSDGDHMFENHTYRCAKEYAITSAVESKVKG